VEGAFQNYEHDQLESPVHERLPERETLQGNFAKNESTIRYLSSSFIKELSERWEKQLLASSCMSVGQHGTTQTLLGGFSKISYWGPLLTYV
jgi:hypothetical protein